MMKLIHVVRFISIALCIYLSPHLTQQFKLDVMQPVLWPLGVLFGTVVWLHSDYYKRILRGTLFVLAAVFTTFVMKYCLNKITPGAYNQLAVYVSVLIGTVLLPTFQLFILRATPSRTFRTIILTYLTWALLGTLIEPNLWNPGKDAFDIYTTHYRYPLGWASIAVWQITYLVVEFFPLRLSKSSVPANPP